MSEDEAPLSVLLRWLYSVKHVLCYTWGDSDAIAFTVLKAAIL